MLWVAALWGLAEATLFFVVPDVVLSALALRHLRRAILACVFALAGAMLGGTLMYFWGAAAPEQAVSIVESVPAISPGLMSDALHSLEVQGAWGMVLGPLSGTPFKVYAVQAAAGGIGFPAFLGASIPARMPRFLIVTIVAGCVARLLRRRLSLRVVYGIWLVLWMAFYAVYFSHMPG